MHWLALAGTVVVALYGIWLLLLAYRLVGRPRGQDPAYDASIDYWSGSFKVVGFLSILVIFLEIAAWVVGQF